MTLITQEERAQLQAAVGPRQTIVATAIARLHLASPDPKAQRRNDPDSILRTFRNLSGDEWTTTNVVGALALVIDRAADAFVFQIFDLQKFSLRFSYEMYVDMTYEVLSPMFHSIEIEDAVAGFCFADAEEARGMLSKVMALRPTSKAGAGAAMFATEKKKGFFRGVFGGGKAGKQGGRPDSLKIGAVRMVQHEQHVGVNADGSFDVNHLAPQWKQLFKQAGVKKKDLQDPETAAAIMATIMQAERQQQFTEMYQAQPEYQGLTEEEIGDAVEDMDDEDMEAYARYEEELRRYHEELAAYEAEQEALEAWEADNAGLVQQMEAAQQQQYEEEEAAYLQEEEEAAAEEEGRGSVVSSKSPPPPLPPRRDLKRADKELKDREKEARAHSKLAAAADRNLNAAVQNYRQSIRRHERSPEEEAYERAAEEARAAAEVAKAAAEDAARERDEIMREIEEMRRRNAEARTGVTAAAAAAAKVAAPAKRVSAARKQLSKRFSRAKTPALPPLPALPALPPPLSAVPPPPPPLPALPPAPPKMPELPPLPQLPSRPKGALPADALAAGIAGAKLKKSPPPKVRAPGVPRPKTGLLGAIEGGVKLKAAPPKSRQSKLPNLGSMKPKAQNALMAKLIETMNTRRAVMNDGDSDDEWSD